MPTPAINESIVNAWIMSNASAQIFFGGNGLPIQSIPFSMQNKAMTNMPYPSVVSFAFDWPVEYQ